LWLLDRVGLKDRAAHKPAELSGGEQQRVSIARALANQPALILLDEPTGDLDSVTGQEIMALLQDLNRREKVTLLIATHDPSIAQASGRIIRLRDGRIEADSKSSCETGSKPIPPS
jgi:ABC-type lipoprotein export system ATPase subunit